MGTVGDIGNKISNDAKGISWNLNSEPQKLEQGIGGAAEDTYTPATKVFRSLS